MTTPQPNRRRLLLSLAAAGTLAGCFGDGADDEDDGEPDDDTDDTDDTDDDDGVEEDPPDDDEDDEDETEDEDEEDDEEEDEDEDEDEIDPDAAADHIDAATDAIQAAVDELARFDDDEFDHGDFSDHVATAESDLDAAADVADDDQLDEIDDLRSVLAYLTPLGDAHGAAGAGFETFEPGLVAYGEAREVWGFDPTGAEYDAAGERFGEAGEAFLEGLEAFADAVDGYETAQEALDTIAPAGFDRFDGLDHGDQTDFLEWTHWFTVNMLWFAQGTTHGSFGWQLTMHAIAEIGREHWDGAAALLADAREEYEAAIDAYGGIDWDFLYSTVPELAEPFAIPVCEIEHGVEMIDYFEAAVEAGAAGRDDESEGYVEGGFDTPRACDEEDGEFDPSLEIAYKYEAHGRHNVEEIEYDPAHDIVWSMDTTLEDENRFVGYDVGAEHVVVEETFEQLHDMAVGEGVVYIDSDGELYEYDVAGGELSEHPAALDGSSRDLVYDADADLIWAANDTEISAFEADTGDRVASYDVHDGGISTIDVYDQWVASGETWEDNVLVYDRAAEDVTFNPKIGYNGAVVQFTDHPALIVGAGEAVHVYDADEELILESDGHIFGTSDVDFIDEHLVVVSVGFDNAIRFHGIEEETVIETYSHDDTIYAASVDAENELLWFGDGEDDNPGTVYGLDLS